MQISFSGSQLPLNQQTANNTFSVPSSAHTVQQSMHPLSTVHLSILCTDGYLAFLT